MREIKGDIWEVADLIGQHTKNVEPWVFITTNGSVKSDGCGVMGAGIAKQARDKFSGIDIALGRKIKNDGNTIGRLCTLVDSKGFMYSIWSLPVKHTWQEPADMELIIKSLKSVHTLWKFYEKPIVILPRPGCGNGRLAWQNVKPVVERLLPEDEFLVVERETYG